MAKQAFDVARFTGFRFDPNDLIVIGIDTKDGEEHPLWDERIHLPLDEAMIVNMQAIGVRDPVKVRKGVRGNKDVAEVVDGRRRVLHAREANKRLEKLGEPLILVPVMVEKGSDDFLVDVSVALNELRKPDDILVKAAKAHRMSARGRSDQEIAVAFGVTPNAIKGWLKLVELPAPIKKAVVDGVLSANAASKLAGLEREEQLKALEELKTQHAETGKRVTGRQAGKKNKKKKQGRPTLKELDQRIDTLSHLNSRFAQGIIAGMQYAQGKKRDDVDKLLKGG